MYQNEVLDEVHEQHASVRVIVQQFATQLEEAQKEEKIWAELELYLQRGWVLHVLTWADRETPRLKRLRTERPQLAASIEAAYRLSKEESKKVFRRYPSLLEDACKNKGIILDTTSRHPKYSVNDRFFTVEIDETRRTARVSDVEGRLAELPCDVDAVVEKLQQERSRIFDRPYNGAEFLKFLRKQYAAILKQDNLVDGTGVPIRSITKRLGKNLKGFRTDEFLVDLSRLAEEGPFRVDGRQLDLQQTKDTNQGMLLHGAAGRGYVGFVVFREEAT